jgi:hypothetical protein
MSEQEKPPTPLAPHDLASFKDLPETSLPSKAAIDDAYKSFKIGGDLQRRITELHGKAGLGSLSRMIEDQARAIDKMFPKDRAFPKDMLGMPAIEPRPIITEALRPPPNPILETNKRLAKIEERFEEMQDIAARGAEIATSLQVSAAEFLTKFDDVATKNDRTAGRAVWVAGTAAVLAVAVPLLQTLYAELWKAPNDAADMRRAVTELKTELTTLRDTQRQVADRIADVVAAQSPANQELVTTLKEIRKALSDPPAKQP